MDDYNIRPDGSGGYCWCEAVMNRMGLAGGIVSQHVGE